MVGKLFVTTLVVFGGVCFAANAQTSDEAIQQCAGKTDEKERLACFDDLAKKIANKKTSEEEKTAKTSEILQPSKPGEYLVVDPGDLTISSNKYIGKPIEVRGMACFHADKGDYRCTDKGASVTVYAAAVEPPSAQEAIENNCGQIKKIRSPQCTKTIRFTPKMAEDRRISGYERLRLILAESIEVVPTAPVATKGKGKRR